jgi:hypothetical protein
MDMHICWKSFLLSFAVAVLLFALLMTAVCLGVFNKFIPSAELDESLDQPTDAIVERSSYESYIFYCNDKENGALDFALLVRVNGEDKQLLVTPLEGEDLLERQGVLFYVRSLCQDYGIGELSPIFEALTGHEASEERILNVRDHMPQTLVTVRYPDFVEILPRVLESTDGFSVVECPLVSDVGGEFRILNVEKSLESFLH